MNAMVQLLLSLDVCDGIIRHRQEHNTEG